MLVAQISKIQQIGIRSGSLFLAASIAALTGSPLAGALLDTDQGGYKYIQIFAGAMMCAAAGIVLISRAFTLGLAITNVWKSSRLGLISRLLEVAMSVYRAAGRSPNFVYCISEARQALQRKRIYL